MKKFFLVYVSVGLNLLMAVILLLVYFYVKQKIDLAAGLLERSAQTVIQQSIPVQDSILVASDFDIKNSIPVGVQMKVNQMIHIVDTLRVKRSVTLPLILKINQIIELDTVFEIREPVKIFMNDTIPLNQTISVQIGAKAFPMPVQTQIPIHQELVVTMPQIPVSGKIPVRFELIDTFNVHLDFPFPVAMNVPVSLFINDPAMIAFYSSLSVQGKIPIMLNVAVNLPLRTTALREKLDSLALILKTF